MAGKQKFPVVTTCALLPEKHYAWISADALGNIFVSISQTCVYKYSPDKGFGAPPELVDLGSNSRDLLYGEVSADGKKYFLVTRDRGLWVAYLQGPHRPAGERYASGPPT